MTTLTLKRAFYRIPLLGWIVRDVAEGDEDNIWYAMVIALTCIVLAVMHWGIVALSMTALALVPVMFVILLAITQG